MVAYELLTGTKPFPGDTLSAVLYRILHEEPAAMAALAPGTPPRLVACIDRCLRKRREDRFDDLSQVATELRAVLAEVEAQPPIAGGAPLHGASPVARAQPGAPGELSAPLVPVSPPLAEVSRSATQVLAGAAASAPTPPVRVAPASSDISRTVPLESSVVSATGAPLTSDRSRLSVALVFGVVAIIAASLAYYLFSRGDEVVTAVADSATVQPAIAVPQQDSAVVTGAPAADSLSRTAVAGADAPAAALEGPDVDPAARRNPTAADSVRAPATAAPTAALPAAQRAAPGTVVPPGAATAAGGASRRAAVSPPPSAAPGSEDARPARDAVAIDPNRVVVFVRGSNAAAVELAEHTLVSDLRRVAASSCRATT
ncbi:MAG: hypothetical protein IPK33_06405 [Gemmatimonadetes bacterium]|nr:hypothetical protein [Gemmatimonadota bacterium]